MLTLLLAACGQQPNKSSEIKSPTSVPINDTAGKGPGNTTTLPAQRDSIKTPARDSASAVADEKLFDAFWATFQKAVKQNDEKQLATLLQFPFQTDIKWDNRDVQEGNVNKQEGLVQPLEFHKYYPGIFHADVKRILPHIKGVDVTELDGPENDDYYHTLQKLTDKGSLMYETYSQYSSHANSYAGSYFGFVFGKVNGAYKALSYYGKWPVKDPGN